MAKIQGDTSISSGNRQRANAPLVKMIVCALDGVENCQKTKGCYGSNYKYLLNQCIRQYLVPDENIHISQGAKRVWQDMGFRVEEIYKYTYQDPITPRCDTKVRTYKGTKKEDIEIDIPEGAKVAFNLVFIEEHTTPVKDVTMAIMCACKEPAADKESVIIKLLDKMHITKMLKCENEKITKNTNRINTGDYINLLPKDIFNKIVNDDKINYPEIE